MSIVKSAQNTINNIKIVIYIERLKRNEKLELVHPNIQLSGLPKSDFPSDDTANYIHSNGFVYKITRKGGKFL